MGDLSSMSIIESIILGMVQGLTEFLPVSSSGHLVIAQQMMGLASGSLTASVVAHFGTLIAILFFYRKQFAFILKGFFDRKSSLLVNSSVRLLMLVIVASIPAGLVGFLLQDFFKSLFASTQWVGGFLLLTAVILLLSRIKTREIEYSENYIKSFAHQMTFTQAFIVGCSQALAICPGLSRSGTTITTSLFLGIKREQAAFFSFLISIPVILGALLLELKEVTLASDEIIPLLIILVSSLVFGWVGLFGVVKVLNRGLLHIFSFYLIPVGLLVLFYL